MSTHHDGPRSQLFTPIPITGNTTLPELAEIALSEEMAAVRDHAPQGACTAWGIPFEVGSVVAIDRQPVTVAIAPTTTRWLVFMHTSDAPPLEKTKDGFIQPPLRGQGRLGEHAADYIICYADGTEARAAIRRRFHIGDFSRDWGENCFAAVARHKPFPVRGAQEQPGGGWGWTQTRVSSADHDPWTNWLWGWHNPHPEKAITALRFEPISGLVIISAVTAGEIEAQPLRWRMRRKACLTLPEGEPFTPDLDEDGLLKQIQLDLGQVISATPRRIYPNENWESTYNNLRPQADLAQVLVEYTAHPEACFHLASGLVIPVVQVESAGGQELLQPVTPATQPVRLRVVEKGSGRAVPVKLHLHGEWGEYLPPVDRHRLPNPEWFEDYSADYLHMDYPDMATAHLCSYIHGETTLRLPPGRVYLEVSKGFEIRPQRQVLTVTPETGEIVIEIEKVLPWRERGWVTADTHVHFLSPMTALLEGAAEGVNIINLLASQWGELMTNVGDFDGKTTWGAREAGGEGEYLVRVGTENRQHVLGHISLLGYRGEMIVPMTTGGPDESALGDPIEVLLTEWARQCRQQDGLAVLPHFPHPRAEHAASIVEGVIDAVEMTAWQYQYHGISPYSLSDWYRYLNCGYLVPAVGGTDKMTAITAVGTVRTYARIPAGVDFTYESWQDAIRCGETFVTYGPLLEFTVDGHPPGSRMELGAGGGTLEVTWQVSSVTVPVSRVELVINGEVRESQAVPPQGAAGSWRVRLEQSGWLALLVRGHYADQPEIIAAHSSPVMALVAGSQLLAAADAVTILEQIEGALAFLDTVGTRAEDRAYKRMRLVLESAHRRLHNRMHQQGHYHDHTPVSDHVAHHPGQQ